MLVTAIFSCIVSTGEFIWTSFTVAVVFAPALIKTPKSKTITAKAKKLCPSQDFRRMFLATLYVRPRLAPRLKEALLK